MEITQLHLSQKLLSRDITTSQTPNIYIVELATSVLNNGGFVDHRPFSFSKKESESNIVLIHFVEFSNVHNSDRSSNVI